MTNTELDYGHVTQTGFFITVKGTEDTMVIYCGDRWAGFAGNGLGFNQWCPVTFNGTDAVFHSLSQWTIDAVKGTWKVGPGNNYVLNPAFEADRLLQSSLTGWTGARNAEGSHVSGRFCLQLSASGTASQNISSLPNGTYDLKVWVQSSGGLSSAKVFVSDFGGSEMSSDINKQMSAWTQVTLSGIKVTSGKIKVGVTTANSGSSWVKLDDFSLVNSEAVRTIDIPHRGNGGFAFNPATYSVQAYGSGKAVRLEMYTLNGKNILRQILVPGSGAEQFRLPVHQFDNGPYLLKMISGGNSSVQKVTIAR
jgi:hypothetical protein